MGRRWLFVAGLLTSMVFADPPVGRQASVEDQLDRLRQVIVDLEKSLKVDIDKNRKAVDTRILNLETALKDLGKTSASSDSSIEKRLNEMQRVATDLRKSVAVQRGDKNHEREIADLRVLLKDIADKLSELRPGATSSNGDMFCEFKQEHRWRKGPHLLDPHLKETTEVRGDRAENLFDALERGCRKCGPKRNYWASPANATGRVMDCCKTPTPQCEKELGVGYLDKNCDFYDVVSCTLVDCVYTKSGDSVAPLEKASKLAPPECRSVAAQAQAPAAPPPTCSIFFSSDGGPNTVHSSERVTLEAVGANLRAAVDAACQQCSALAQKLKAEYKPMFFVKWSCADLRCFNRDSSKKPVYLQIPKEIVPKNCLFQMNRY